MGLLTEFDLSSFAAARCFWVCVGDITTKAAADVGSNEIELNKINLHGETPHRIGVEGNEKKNINPAPKIY